MSAFDLVRERLEEHGSKVKGDGRKLDAQCPAHEDNVASLTVTRANDRVLIRCHAGTGCDIEDILVALKLAKADLFDSPLEVNHHGDRGTTYDYTDELGELLFQVIRSQQNGKKRFTQRKPDGKGGWEYRLGDTRRPLYRLPKVLQAIKDGQHIWVVEGEKDVQAIERANGVATTNPHGAGKWLPAHSESLREANVTVVADCDMTGRAHARMVADSLAGVAGSVMIAEAKHGKDISDHLAGGFALDDLLVTRDSSEAGRPDLAPDLHEFLAGADPEIVWCIPFVLEAGDRFILTGPEGHGKSLLTYQMGVAAAAGIHPFTNAFITPQKVLMIDCENNERISRRRLRRLELLTSVMGKRVADGQLHVIHRPEGIDLSGDDALWLTERVIAHKPDLITIGPLYRLHVIDLNEEMAARQVTRALDQARLATGATMLIEAHSPHGESLLTRTLRPAGSSLFLRWPEAGYGLRPAPAPGMSIEEFEEDRTYKVEQWRGPREERTIPRKLTWGDPNAGDWPWIAA